MDQSYFIFWSNDEPSLEFRPSDKITFNGENVLDLRKDISQRHLLTYIQAFYKVLDQHHLYRNLKTLSAAAIINLQRGRALVKVPSNDVDIPPPQKSYNAVSLNYSGIKEKAGFYKPNACKLLAFKVLYETENVPDRLMPVDIFELNLFFSEHFEGSPKEVFSRFCEHHNLQEKEILQQYRNKVNWDSFINDVPCYKIKPKEKKHTESEGLINAFLQILR